MVACTETEWEKARVANLCIAFCSIFFLGGAGCMFIYCVFLYYIYNIVYSFYVYMKQPWGGAQHLGGVTGRVREQVLLASYNEWFKRGFYFACPFLTWLVANADEFLNFLWEMVSNMEDIHEKIKFLQSELETKENKSKVKQQLLIQQLKEAKHKSRLF